MHRRHLGHLNHHPTRLRLLPPHPPPNPDLENRPCLRHHLRPCRHIRALLLLLCRLGLALPRQEFDSCHLDLLGATDGQSPRLWSHHRLPLCKFTLFYSRQLRRWWLPTTAASKEKESRLWFTEDITSR